MPEAPDIGRLKEYKASICLKENNHPINFESQKMSIHNLPLVKLKKMAEQGIFKRFPQCGNSWPSPIVAIRKPNGNLGMTKLELIIRYTRIHSLCLILKQLLIN